MNPTLNAQYAGKTAIVTKGCAAKRIQKGDKITNIQVYYVMGTGFRVHFNVQGLGPVIMWAASAARLKNTVSLNTGDPTKRVVFTLV